MNDTDNAAPTIPTETERGKDTAEAAVDVQKLAERVYDLMREELRLERARGIKRNSFRRN